MTTAATQPILICYDGSPGALRAIESAAALFPGHHAVVLHVWSPISLIVARYGGFMSVPAFEDDELRVAAMQLAERGASVAAAAGLLACADTAETSYDGTAPDILAAADRHDAAVIVLGARGLSAFKSMLLGSVSHSVAQHARRPVMIVPPAARVEHGEAPVAVAAAIA